MSARRAEPVALRGGLTTRRATSQRDPAIGAKPVAIPPGRTAPRTRHHETVIPRHANPATSRAPDSDLSADLSSAQKEAICARLPARPGCPFSRAESASIWPHTILTEGDAASGSLVAASTRDPPIGAHAESSPGGPGP